MQISSRSLGTLQRCLRCALVAVAILGAAPGLFAADTFKMPVVVNGKTYQADAVIQSDGSIKVVVAVVLVFRQDGEVQPGPGPKPPPDPPTPTKITSLYLIHESGDGTPQFTGIRNAAAWKQEADRLGIRWLVVDKDTAKAKLPEAVKKAVAVGLPAVVLLDAQGLGVAEKCPATPDAMLERVRKAGKP